MFATAAATEAASFGLSTPVSLALAAGGVAVGADAVSNVSSGVIQGWTGENYRPLMLRVMDSVTGSESTTNSYVEASAFSLPFLAVEAEAGLGFEAAARSEQAAMLDRVGLISENGAIRM